MTILEALRQVTSSIKTWADNKFLNKDTTADDFGIYVQDTEPLNAIDGDIWIDTASDPSIIPNTDIPNALPTVTTADNGKVLMVVNGSWQAVDLNMSVDANGVVSI